MEDVGMGTFLTANFRSHRADVKEKERSSPTARERDSTRDSLLRVSVRPLQRAAAWRRRGRRSSSPRALLRLATSLRKTLVGGSAGLIGLPAAACLQTTRSAD